MAQIKKNVGCVLGVILSLAVLGFFLFRVLAWFPDCDEDSEAVRFARSLSQERLAKLYYDMARASKDPHVPTFGYSNTSKEENKHPEPFTDIEAILVRPREANIKLVGCIDYDVALDFFGPEFSSNNFHPELDEIPGKLERYIVLSWGPEFKAEILWREKK